MRRRIGIILVISALFAALAVPVSRAAPPEGKPNPNEKALVSCDNTSGHPNRPRFCTATVLEVDSSGLADTEIGALRTALELQDAPEENFSNDPGVFRYLDPELFQVVPSFRDVAQNPLGGDDATEQDAGGTTTDVLDIASILELDSAGVLSGGDALGKIHKALTDTGLAPDNFETLTANATFYLERNPALFPSQVPELPIELRDGVELDTQVSYQLVAGEGENSIPVTGPGAKIKVSFAPDGTVTQLLYSAVELTGEGPQVQVIPEDQAPALCQEALDLPAGSTPSAELVYYAPPLDSGIEQVLPHFVCSSSSNALDPAGDLLQSRDVLIPAVVDAPQVSIDASIDGTLVHADSDVVGGTAPYSYQWSSALTMLPAEEATKEDISYAPDCRAADQSVGHGDGHEELILTVTDANGLQATERAEPEIGCEPTSSGEASSALESTSLGLAGTEDGASAMSHSGGFQVGIDWVGTFNHNNDLAGVPSNASGFVNRFDDFTGIAFNWGNNNAWERDFKDLDTTVADAADLTFYTGHANGNGWVMESNASDQWVNYNDTALGDHDNEWLVIGACGVLQDSTSAGSWATRWGPAFQGMHMILGYATVSNDTTQEGSRFANYTDAGWYLYQAWGQQAIDIQPSSVQYGYGGPVSFNYEWNAYDHYWGQGTVTGDIPASNTWYYWRTVGNA